MRIMTHVRLDYGSKRTAHVSVATAFGTKLICDSARCEKIIVPCFNTVVRKYFKIFYDK